MNVTKVSRPAIERRKKRAHEPLECRVCGVVLHHKGTGRPKTFCSAKCRKKFSRAEKKWARRCIDAWVAGKEEPDHPYPFKVSKDAS